jgi:DNA-directed RNA polymerase subunit RPC12/RpoP
MNYLKERVSYLKGLAEGMQISDSTNEGKLLKAILEVLDDVALAVDDVEEVQEQLTEQIDEIDEDLSEIESLIYDDEDECCDDECCDEDEEEDGEEEEEIDAEFDCPHCGETVNLEDAYMKKDSVLCPHCNKEIEIEWTCDCDECAESSDDSDK